MCTKQLTSLKAFRTSAKSCPMMLWTCSEMHQPFKEFWSPPFRKQSSSRSQNRVASCSLLRTLGTRVAWRSAKPLDPCTAVEMTVLDIGHLVASCRLWWQISSINNLDATATKFDENIFCAAKFCSRCSKVNHRIESAKV